MTSEPMDQLPPRAEPASEPEPTFSCAECGADVPAYTVCPTCGEVWYSGGLSALAERDEVRGELERARAKLAAWEPVIRAVAVMPRPWAWTHHEKQLFEAYRAIRPEDRPGEEVDSPKPCPKCGCVHGNHECGVCSAVHPPRCPACHEDLVDGRCPACSGARLRERAT